MVGNVSPARKRLQRNASILVLVGILCNLLAGISGGGDDAGSAAVVLILSLIGVPCWILGLMAYAQNKGHSKWVGLLGLFGCFGLFVLVLLRNRWTEPSPTGCVPGDYPRPHG